VEILGLGYRLQTAGARAVIASLWAVNDGGTQALMNAFYSALKKDKITKTEALRQAQIAMIKSDRPANPSQRASIEIIQNGVPPEVGSHLSHPFYWAPFILIGNGL
jgi:CHAT domain-containing protein